METHFEVVLSGRVCKFPHEPAVVRFLLGLGKWGKDDEVRFVSGGIFKMRWRIEEFLK